MPIRFEGTIKCPYHYERTPSCMVSARAGNFRCLSCGKSGTFKQLLRTLSRKAELAYEDGPRGKAVKELYRQGKGLPA